MASLRTLCLSLLLALLGACAAPATQPDDSLYRALGEEAGIARITDEFLFAIGDDPRVRDFFADSDIERFREKLIEHLCELSGGPCRYSGDSMPEVHREFSIRDAHFNAIVEDLILAMERAGTPVGAQNRLLAILARLHGQIVGQDRPR